MKDIVFSEVSPDAMKKIWEDISAAIHPVTISPDQALVQVADLPFYEAFKLYAVTDLRLPSGNAHELLLGPGGAFLLNGANEPIYKVNQMAPVKLDPATLAPYIRFFLHHTVNAVGRFIVAETAEDIPWLADADEEEMATAAALLEPITCKGIDENGIFTLTGTLVFRDGLFRSDIKVATVPVEVKIPDLEEPVPFPIGGIGLVNEEMLLEDLDVHSAFVAEEEADEIDEEEDGDENGASTAPPFVPYDVLPRIDGINFKEQPAEEAERLVGVFPPELQAALTSTDGFVLSMADLPFYPELVLCALTARTDPPPNIFLFLFEKGPEGGIFPMNMTNEPLYAVNEHLAITLTAETLPCYAKFFFFLVRGQLGQFNIVEKPEDVVWLPRATKKEKAAVARHLMPVAYEGIDADGLHSLKATVIFKNALFRTDIKVAPHALDVFDAELNATERFVTGQMKLTNEDLLVEELNVPVD